MSRSPLFSSHCPIRIGTSGYSYRNWHTKQNYYPTKDEFNYYCHEFNTVEVNSTFYNIPPETTFKSWTRKVPRESFVYTIKANNYFTHTKQMQIDENWINRWENFWSKCQILGRHLGPILFQMPPGFKNTSTNIERLDELANVLSKDGKFAFEFRDRSWFCEDIYLLMKKYNWCLCVIDCENSKNWCGNMPSGMLPVNIDDHQTCDWGVYYRFHGATGQYSGAYGEQRMRDLAEMTSKQYLHESIELYFYFNNTETHSPPAAIQDCRYLAKAFKDLQIMSKNSNYE